MYVDKVNGAWRAPLFGAGILLGILILLQNATNLYGLA